jgi:hypothetical protein
MRSSGAPVSVAAGFPRRLAPRRPLNADIERPLQIKLTGRYGSRVRIRGIRKQPFADAIFLSSLTVSFGRGAVIAGGDLDRPKLADSVNWQLSPKAVRRKIPPSSKVRFRRVWATAAPGPRAALRGERCREFFDCFDWYGPRYACGTQTRRPSRL